MSSTALASENIANYGIVARKSEPFKVSINPLYGLMREAKRDPLHFFSSVVQGHRLVEIPNPSGKFYLVNDAEFVEHILAKNAQNFPKSDYYERIKPIFGEGLFELEGEKWQRKRKCFSPAFAAQHYDRFVKDAITAADDACATLSDNVGTVCDICPLFMAKTFHFIIQALCTSQIKIDAYKLSNDLCTIMKAGERVLWAINPTIARWMDPNKKALKAAVDAFDALIYELIETRLENGDAQNDLLDLLLTQKDPKTGDPVPLKELRDDLLTMLIAGHETTAMAISWAFYAMSMNPTLRVRLEKEASGIDFDNLTLADLKKYPYSSSIGQEALRLHPPFWTLSRKSKQADTLGPYEVEAGATFMISPYVLHRNPKYWPNPLAFEPERFSPEIFRNRPSAAYIPFGSGPRMCIGRSLALMELQVFLLRVAKSFRLNASVGSKVEPEPMISLRAKQGIHMFIQAI